MKKLFVIILFLLTIDGIAQPLIWQRTYESPFHQDGEAWDVCQTTDGNYVTSSILGTQTYILKINIYGDTIWTRMFTEGYPLTITASNDNGCVFTGSGYATKINSQGNLVWYKTYNVGTVQLWDMKRTTDNGYIICGRKDYNYGFLMKIDMDGNLQWQKSYPSVYVGRFYSVDACINGGYIAGGYSYDGPTDTTKALLTKVDNSGNLIWEKKYKIFNRGANIVSVKNIGQYYIIGGSTSDSNQTSKGVCYFSKVDDNGTILSANYANSSLSESLNDLKIIDNKRYILTTEVLDGSDYLYSKAVIIDSSGNVIHQRSFTAGTGSNSGTYLKQAEVVSNGYIMMAGGGQFSTPGDYKIYIVRCDSLLSETPFLGLTLINNEIPKEFKLHQNYPNPFNPTTKIKFDIPQSGMAKMILYNITGQIISEIFNKEIKAGTYEVDLNMSDKPSGVYFVKLEAVFFTQTKKMVLVK